MRTEWWREPCSCLTPSCRISRAISPSSAKVALSARTVEAHPNNSHSEWSKGFFKET